MPTFRYRVVLDFEIETSELTLEDIRERYEEHPINLVDHFALLRAANVPVPPPEEYLGDLRLLHQELLASPEVLDRWIKRDIASLLDSLSLCRVEGVDNSDAMLMPVIERLPPKQRHRFRELLAKDIFCDTSAALFSCFKMFVSKATIEGSGRLA